MESLGLILDHIDISKFGKGADHYVYVIKVVDPHNFYVRPSKYIPFIERLESLEPIGRPAALSLNDIIIFDMNKSNHSPKYSRGKITRILTVGDTVMCDILALDYGHICEKIEERYIWECNGSLAKLPLMAVHCKLANCTMWLGDKWDTGSIEAFQYYIADKQMKMHIFDKKLDQFIVQLKNSHPYDVATLLAMSGFCVLRYEYEVTT